jgi:hypothetical protein
MNNFCYRVSSYVRTYWNLCTPFLKRLYAVGLVLVVAGIVGIPVVLGIINPHVRLPDIHGGPPPALMREWNTLVNRARREQSRINDFTVMIHRLSENYPFFALAEARTGMHYIELAIQAYNELVAEGLHDVSTGFYRNFLQERYLALLGGYGNVRVVSEPAYVRPGWIHQPYFFGLYDWRFADERIDVEVREGNAQTQMLEDGTGYVRIHSFLAKGYEAISRDPFYYFDAEEEYRLLTAFFAEAEGDLVIDIRGIGSGFGDYFVPMVLAPLLNEAVGGRFYAFYMDGFMARQVSDMYRDWYMFGDAFPAGTLGGGFAQPLPEWLEHGFVIDLEVNPAMETRTAGNIWLLTDNGNFTGPNYMYLQLARDAGFIIVYEENADVAGWETSYIRLPHSGLYLRFNPLYFTDRNGLPLEGAGAFYDYRWEDVAERWGFVSE